MLTSTIVMCVIHTQDQAPDRFVVVVLKLAVLLKATLVMSGVQTQDYSPNRITACCS